MEIIPRPTEFFDELELDTRSGNEILQVLSAGGYRISLDDLLERPFRKRRGVRRPTRFSDGSFPVFYSSFCPATAEAEVKHWFPRFGGAPESPRTAYYQTFACTFDGTEIDLRPKIKDWPDLIHDSDYSFCNRLGSEARRLQLDALVTQSARHSGSNLAVFRRPAVHNATLEGIVAFTYDPNTGKASAGRIEDQTIDPQMVH